MNDPIAPQLEAFEACYRHHLALTDGAMGNMDLKRDHCLRVLAEARMITASLTPADGLDPELERLTHIAALFHDAGRFPQLVRYGTFNDTRSENHGVLGVKALRSCGLLAGLDQGQARLVRAVVCMHNRRNVPRGLPARTGLALSVVRDADKLDILPVMLDHFRPGVKNDVVTLNLEHHETAFTPAMLERLEQRKLGIYEDMRFVNDFKLLLLSWVYGMNFPVARRAFLERGHLDGLMDALPEIPQFSGLRERLAKDLEEA